MIKELKSEQENLQKHIDTSVKEAQRKLQLREEELHAAHKAELDSIIQQREELLQSERRRTETAIRSEVEVALTKASEDIKAKENRVIMLQNALAAARAKAEHETAALRLELTELSKTSQARNEELQKEWLRSQASTEAAEAERTRLSHFLKLSEERLSAAQQNVLMLQADLTQALQEKAALASEIEMASAVTGNQLSDVQRSYEGQIELLGSQMADMTVVSSDQVEAAKRKSEAAEEEVHRNMRLLQAAKIELTEALDAKQQLIHRTTEMAAEHASSQARLQEELDALRSASVEAEAASSEHIRTLQSRLDAAQLAGEQEAQSLRQEMEKLVLNASLERGQMEDRLVQAEARLSEALKGDQQQVQVQELQAGMQAALYSVQADADALRAELAEKQLQGADLLEAVGQAEVKGREAVLAIQGKLDQAVEELASTRARSESQASELVASQREVSRLVDAVKASDMALASIADQASHERSVNEAEILRLKAHVSDRI